MPIWTLEELRWLSKKEIYEDYDVGIHDVVIYQTYRQDNVAIEIASANFIDIIHAVNEIRHITHNADIDIKDNPIFIQVHITLHRI